MIVYYLVYIFLDRLSKDKFLSSVTASWLLVKNATIVFPENFIQF
jgi:hypothetical protein